MPSRRPSRLMVLLDCVSGGQLAILAITLTLSFGFMYWYLSRVAPDQGLVTYGSDPKIGFIDAIYFSIVTETTLGYGDIQPIGASRLLACVNVILGLILGGVVVAKITSAHDRDYRIVARYAAGDWIDICMMPDGKIIVGLSTIYAAKNGIYYDGENFDSKATPLGFFRSELIEMDEDFLRFRYSNRESATQYFGEGIVGLRFVSDGNSKYWNRYHATIHDFVTGQQITFEGFRALPQESFILRGSDHQARLQIVKTYAARFSQ